MKERQIASKQKWLWCVIMWYFTFLIQVQSDLHHTQACPHGFSHHPHPQRNPKPHWGNFFLYGSERFMTTVHMITCHCWMPRYFCQILPEQCEGWIRHAMRYYPWCITRDNIRWDVDENSWLNAEEQRDKNLTAIELLQSWTKCKCVYFVSVVLTINTF